MNATSTTKPKQSGSKPAAKRDMGIRASFRIAIVAVAALALLAVASISFWNVSESELRRAQEAMKSEVNYLHLQLDTINRRTSALEKLANSLGKDAASLAEQYPGLLGSSSSPITDLIHGYTLAQTGTVAIIAEGRIVASDDPNIPADSDAKELLGEDVMKAIEESCESGQVKRIVNTVASAGPKKPSGTEAYLLAGQQDQHTVLIIQSASMVFEDRFSLMVRVLTIALAVLIVVLFMVDRMLNLLVARQIDKTNDALSRITAGDLGTRVENKGTREFKSLSAGINHTVDSLQSLIAEAETRMDAELATARTIQESALPGVFPPYPDINKFDLYASMQAARQVGGDFYDFFLIGDSKTDAGLLGFVVADVSGKGVPAALLMMKAKAQIRDYLLSGAEIGEAMEEVNRQLCDGNDAGMFVTAWVGVLDYATGHVDYVNAGHNPPLLWQRDGGWRWLRERSGPMLGLFEGRSYKVISIDCKPEDFFLLYTDGVTEAFDAAENPYGEERLLAAAQEGYRLHPRELIEFLRADVAAFTEGTDQSDDITLLALEVGVPPEITATLEVDALISELDRVNAFLHAELDRRLCPSRIQNLLDVAVEELFVNVCNYAYADADPNETGVVRIQRTYHADPASITVDIIDTGTPFNPLEKPDAVTPKDIADVPIGGLGILMTKRTVDEIRYERVGNANVVTIVKRW